MPVLPFVDHRQAPQAWARQLGISHEAVDLYLASDVIDLHVDSFIWTRVFGYDLTRRHAPGALKSFFYGHVDFPRALEAQLSGATWVITTNPLRTARGRSSAFFANLHRLTKIFASVTEQFALVRTESEYRRARASGLHAAFLGVQGGNALDHDLADFDRIPEGAILRITLVHLTSSSLGATSSPLALGRKGLSPLGIEYVRRMNEKRILVDLAHIDRTAFFDAVRVSDPSQPLAVTHTGVSGAYEHWRNLDDEQLRAVADRGGTVGIMYHSSFLEPTTGRGRAASIVDHIDHVVRTVGEDHVSLGSDWDGAIVTPRDMPTCLELPRLVQLMLERGYRTERISKILSGNFLRTVRDLRPD